MKKNIPAIHVVPANPGFFAVYDLPGQRLVEIGDPVVAWRIETFESEHEREAFSEVYPLTHDVHNCIECFGVQNPDSTITVFGIARYASIEELQAERYPDIHVAMTGENQ